MDTRVVNIAFLCSIDVRHIKQRQQFLADAMNVEGGKVTLFYARSWRRAMLVRNENLPNCRTIPMLVTPYRLRQRLRYFEMILQALWAVVVLVCARPQVVYVAGPRLATTAFVLQRIFKRPIIHDVMDRIEEFPGIDPQEKAVADRLNRRASLILCTSSTLVADVRETIPSVPVVLVPNALHGEHHWYQATKVELPSTDAMVLGYFGAISPWFDFAMLTEALSMRPQWILRAWGICDTETPSTSQIELMGPVAHDRLPALMSDCDVLVMPFILNRLIEAVDPVKAYEYIATGRPVVLTHYSETERFLPYVELYEPGSAQAFIDAVETARANPESEVTEFIRQNSWRERGAVALDAIRHHVL